MLKKIVISLLMVICILSVTPNITYATSLDDIIGEDDNNGGNTSTEIINDDSSSSNGVDDETISDNADVQL